MRTDAVPNSMHGHADCLSLVASLRGRRVLVDSGFYSYNAGGDWEAHFRETAAHSTDQVDGRDQARHIGKMAWSHSYRAAMEHGTPTGAAAGSWARTTDTPEATPAFAIAAPCGCGQTPGCWFTTRSRALARTPTRRISSSLPACCTIAAARLVRRRGDIAWTSPQTWTPRIVTGGPGPADGWIAEPGVRVPAPRLTLTCATDTPHRAPPRGVGSFGRCRQR